MLLTIACHGVGLHALQEVLDGLRSDCARSVSAQNLTHFPVFPFFQVYATADSQVVEVSKKDVDAGADLEAGAGSDAGDAPKANVVAAVFASICMGLVFGVVMDLAKVTNPVVIREQFIFQRFIMLKMFLGAAGGSGFFFAILSKVAPRRFEVARAGFFPGLVTKGITAVTVGPFLLGVGMALAGACPGMVLIQCGSGVKSGPVTLAGGLVASILFALVQPYLVGFMASCRLKKERVEDITMFSKVPFWVLGMSVAVMCFVVVGIFEGFFPWNSGPKISPSQNKWLWNGELPSFSTPWDNTFPPELMGLIVGSMQVPCVLFCLDTLGSSTAYMTFTSQWLVVGKELQSKLPHWNGYRVGIGNWWQAIYIMFAILGAFISSWTTGTFASAASPAEWEGFLGGFIMLFGSRLGSGCTSGHGLSGFGLVALKSIVAVPAMFAGGIVTGFIYHAVDPARYNGFAYQLPALQ